MSPTSLAKLVDLFPPGMGMPLLPVGRRSTRLFGRWKSGSGHGTAVAKSPVGSSRDESFKVDLRVEDLERVAADIYEQDVVWGGLFEGRFFQGVRLIGRPLAAVVPLDRKRNDDGEERWGVLFQEPHLAVA